MSSSPVGKGVASWKVLVADLIDTVPAIAATWLLAGVASATLAFAGGFVVWLLATALSRSLTTTSLGGLVLGLRWVTKRRQAPEFAAAVKHAAFSQVYAALALTTWLLFALVMPWRLLNPATWKAFDVPNTELFGILVDRRP